MDSILKPLYLGTLIFILLGLSFNLHATMGPRNICTGLLLLFSSESRMDAEAPSPSPEYGIYAVIRLPNGELIRYEGDYFLSTHEDLFRRASGSCGGEHWGAVPVAFGEFRRVGGMIVDANEHSTFADKLSQTATTRVVAGMQLPTIRTYYLDDGVEFHNDATVLRQFADVTPSAQLQRSGNGGSSSHLMSNLPNFVGFKNVRHDLGNELLSLYGALYNSHYLLTERRERTQFQARLSEELILYLVAPARTHLLATEAREALMAALPGLRSLIENRDLTANDRQAVLNATSQLNSLQGDGLPIRSVSIMGAPVGGENP